MIKMQITATANLLASQVEARPNPYQDYLDGLKYLYDQGFLLLPDKTSARALHTAYRLSKPRQILGVNYPSDWHYWKKITSEKQDLIDLTEAIRTTPLNGVYEQFKYWQKPKSKDNALIDNALLSLEVDPFEPVSNYISLVGSNSFNSSIHEEAPTVLKYVPPLEWFDKSLLNFDVSELFTIFDKTEIEALMIVIGKIVTGQKDSVNAEGEAVNHTYRSVPLIVGKEAGLGKSMLITTHLTRALQWLGYSVVSIGSLGQQFGLTRVVNSDLTIFDDLTEKTCHQLITSPQFKTLASNLGFIPCEEKYSPYTVEISRTTVLAITNEFWQGWSHLWDSGQRSRILLLSTKDRCEVKREMDANIKALEDRYEVPIMTLMLLVLRKSADYFAQNSQNLRPKIDGFKSALRLQFTDNLGCKIFNAIYFCAVLTNQTTDWVTLDDLERHWLLALDLLIVTKNQLATEYLDSWAKSDRSVDHPGWVLHNISLQSLRATRQQVELETRGVQQGSSIANYEEFVLKLFSSLRFETGLTIRVKRLEYIRDQLSMSVKERDRIKSYFKEKTTK